MLVFEPSTELFAELPRLETSPDQDARARALSRMQAQMRGEAINQSEGRAVGHEWLRRPSLAKPAIAQAIQKNLEAIRGLEPQPSHKVLLIGIGGSALGVQLVSQALVTHQDRLISLDNADPQGLMETLAAVDPKTTIPVVVTKSGGTAETRSAWLAARAHWEGAGLRFEDAAIVVTDPESPFARETQTWRARFDIWPWVGGRFCVSSPAGLLPLHLLGVDTDAFLQGAASIDAWTAPERPSNVALEMAHSLFAQQARHGLHSLAILPYRDRLRLLGQYLQQLIMESLGKNQDLDGQAISQGLSVFGQRGSTDQHSILQHLTQGRPDTQTVLIESRADAPSNAQLADEHLARVLGTHQALCEAKRPPIFLSIPDINAKTIGALIALFERVVGYYAGMANLNAYDQPGVEAGKKASIALLNSKEELGQHLQEGWSSCESLANRLSLPISVTWRLAMQWVSQGKALSRQGEEPASWEFAALGHSHSASR